MTTKPVFCGRDCGGGACPLLAEIESGRVVGIRHNPAAGKYIRGCAKGFALPHFHYSPERIKTPLVRTGSKGSLNFSPVSWEDALSLIRERLGDIIAKHGNGSIISLSSAGSTGALHNTEVLTTRFLNSLGGCVELSGSYSCNAAVYSLRKAFGADFPRSGFDQDTVKSSRMIVLWGANVLEARLGAELPTRLLEARVKGVPIVYIDPRKTSTATTLNAEWFPIKPGTDAALMYALLHVLLESGSIDSDYVARRSVGFDGIRDYVTGRIDGIEKDPRWASAITGIDAKEIVGLAKRWSSISPTMLIPGYSIQRTSSGEEVMRLSVALQLATGNFGLVGGSTGSLNNRMPGPRVGQIPSEKSPANPEVPVVRWADAILGSEPQHSTKIRAAYSAGGNFLNQGADLGKNIRAFESLEFAVCHEMFLTPTARYCDVILPAASPLQKEDIGLAWAGNYILYKPRVVSYEGLERSDYEIFSALADRFGVEKVFTGGNSEHDWIEQFIRDSDVKDVEAFKTDGIFLGEESGRTGLRDFALDPEAHPLATSSGKVDLNGPRWETNSLSGAAGGPGFPFLLVTPKAANRVHSQGGDHPESICVNKLGISEKDADLLGFKPGELACIRSEIGVTYASVVPSDRIAPGVVSLDEGTWYDASARPDDSPGCANMLISTEGTVESVSCIMHGIPVNLEKA